jgi:hypothetical protein
MLSHPRNEPSRFVPGQAPPNFGRQRAGKHAHRTTCMSSANVTLPPKFAGTVYEMLTGTALVITSKSSSSRNDSSR